MIELTTTLKALRAHGPCAEGWAKLLRHLGKTQADDETLPFATILDSNGLDDALWCCRAAPEYSKQWRLFAVWCARQVQHLMTDPRSVAALDVAERHANGQASEKKLAAAWNDARDAAWAAAMAVQKDAACAASVATTAAAWSAVADAAPHAARAAASAATAAAWEAAASMMPVECVEARDTAWAAAWQAAVAMQAAEFRRLVTEGEMTKARCQLVREIEEAADAVRGVDDPTVFAPAIWQRMIDLWKLQMHPEWPRIRAALEAAEDTVLFCESAVPHTYAGEAAKRYRAATRKP